MKGLVRDGGRHGRKKGGLSSLSAMPPVAASEVSFGLEPYAVGPLHGKIVVDGTYLEFPSGLCKATT